MENDESSLSLTRKEFQVSEHYYVDEFRLSDEMRERYEEEPEAVMKELLKKHGYTVRDVDIRGDPERFLTGEVFCYKHVKSPPDAVSFWEPYPCEGAPATSGPDRLEDFYQKLRATLAIWGPSRDPRPPRP